MAKILNAKFIIMILVSFALIYYYFYNNSKDEEKSDIAFLFESKEIQKRDFSTLLESIMPKRQQEPQVIIESKEPPPPTQEKPQKEDKPQEKPLKLLAMLNDAAYITNAWYRKNDIIIHNDTRYKLAQINDYDVVLLDSNNKALKLEIFEVSKDLFIKIH